MMEYKRFVSYLYRYEGGQKERNAGFVRMEVRNRQCRIRIFLHHLPVSREEGEAWVFRQDKGRFDMVFLGKFSVQEGGAEAYFNTLADSFMDSGFALTAFSGLAVFIGKAETLYLTVWDDRPVDLEEIRRRGEKTEEDAEREEDEKVLELEPAEKAQVLRLPGSGMKEERSREGKTESGEPEIQLGELEEGLGRREKEPGEPKTKDEEPKEETRTPQTGSGKEREEFPGTESELQGGETVEEYKTGAPAGPGDSVAMQQVENPPGPWTPDAVDSRLSGDRDFRIWWKQVLEAGASAVQKVVSPKQTGECSFMKKSGRLPDLDELPDISDGKGTAAPDWKELCRLFPRFLPEGQPEDREFLRLSLQDIGRLPRQYWDFGRNAFVLYGYSLENHLILVRDGKAGHFLGVPGKNLGKDRLAAEMFGFRTYVKFGKKGYWLTGIKL